MIPKNIPSAPKRGYCNTPAQCQNTLITHLDYLTVNITLPSEPNNDGSGVPNLDSIHNFLRCVISHISPPPADNWANERKSGNYKKQKKHYQIYKEQLALSIATYEKNLSDSYELVDKPYKVNDVLYFPGRVNTRLPFQAGYQVNELNTQLFIRFSGGWFDLLPNPTDQIQLLKDIAKYPLICSRIDIAIDDKSYSLIPYEEMLQAVRSRDCSGFRSANHIEDLDFSTKEHRANTLYLGGRKSPEFTRIYNHNDECLRWEKELKGDAARNLFLALTLKKLTQPELHQFLTGVAIGSINFLDRTSPSGNHQKHLDRCPEFDWWQKFLEIAALPLRLPRVIRGKTLQKTVDWLHRQVSGTLYAFYKFSTRLEFESFLNQLFARHEINPSDNILLTMAALSL